MIDPTASVLEALALLQGNVDRERKARANEHLQQFQKSEAAWPASVALLQDAGSPVEAKLFASQTLKGKVRSYTIS